MPGANTRALEKGRELPCDGIILDLEDAVSPNAKDEARDNIVNATAEGGYGKRELLFRTNALSTPWGYDDVCAAAQANVHGVLIPKVESADEVRQVESILDANGAPDELKIWCMMETPRGILRAEEIAGATPRLGGFVMGTSDLAKDMQASHTPMRLPFISSLSMCILAGRAEGLAVLDGVFLDLDDAEGFEESCQQGLELGFDGKTLIHPKQLGAANEAFAPSEEQVEFSRKIIEAHAEAEKEGKGVVVVDGKLIENLHVENAKRLVTMAEMIEEMKS
jgi:citrate lyase subunit beta/citryl-CoA lyase